MDTVLRATSTYSLRVTGDEALLQKMRRECPVLVAGAYMERDTVVFRFRTAGGDKRALQIAHDLLGDIAPPFELSTGVGVNRRDLR